MKRALLAVAALVLVAGVAFARSRRDRPVARVGPAVVAARLVARAEVVAVDGVAEVHPQVAGRVRRVLVREGDRVAAGALLAEIEAAGLGAELERREAEQSALRANASALAARPRRDERDAAEAERAAAQQEYELARDRAERQERLQGAGSATAAESFAARTIAAGARARLRAAEARAGMTQHGGRHAAVRAARERARAAGAAVAQAREELDHARLVAPVAGVVLARRVDPGDTVGPRGEAAALFEIADPTRLEVRAEVESLDAPRVDVGQRVRVVTPETSEALAVGVVARVSPRFGQRRIGLDDARVRAEGAVRAVWVTPDAPGGLSLGQRVEVEIALAPRRVAATVPRAAVWVTSGTTRVRTPTLAGLWTTERLVRLGAADERNVELVEGVAAGAVVELRPEAP
jgi:multidrug resistance efflux pump